MQSWKEKRGRIDEEKKKSEERLKNGWKAIEGTKHRVIEEVKCKSKKGDVKQMNLE
jgi:hypothetical protein